IKKDEIDIYDIPIARITMQYMQYIEMMKILNLELAGEYILMAATLIRIKARLLLPRDEHDSEEEDPRQELVSALLEYKKFKEAGDILREKRILEERVFVPPSIEGNFSRQKVVLSDSTTLYDMLTAFRDVLDRVGKDSFYEIQPQEVTVEDRIIRIIDVLNARESVTFRELFDDVPGKLIAILTFLAVLELARLHRVSIRQSLPFSELRVYRGELYDTPLPSAGADQPPFLS
ncbi:MAG: segregation/condensation protein A, partial [Candidatus Zixiibacteriota bacterium]